MASPFHWLAGCAARSSRGATPCSNPMPCSKPGFNPPLWVPCGMHTSVGKITRSDSGQCLLRCSGCVPQLRPRLDPRWRGHTSSPTGRWQSGVFSEVQTDRLLGDLNEKQEEYLKDISASGPHLLSLTTTSSTC